jgi:hypothetical protein
VLCSEMGRPASQWTAIIPFEEVAAGCVEMSTAEMKHLRHEKIRIGDVCWLRLKNSFLTPGAPSSTMNPLQPVLAPELQNLVEESKDQSTRGKPPLHW